MSKPNVMIFRNGGRQRMNEKAYINNEPLVKTTYYKYLGIMFSFKLSLTYIKNIYRYLRLIKLYIHTIKFINRECNDLPVQLLFDLFDKLM